MIALYTTWIVLLLLVVAIYKYVKRDFASPAFLLSVSFFASFSLIVLNIENWDISIHGYYWYTTLCILCCIISFTIGTMLIRPISRRNALKEIVIHPQIETRSNNYPYGAFCVFSILVFLLFLHFNIKNFSLSSFQNFTESLSENYDSGRQGGFFKSQILEIMIFLAYISYHRILVDCFYLKKKISIMTVIPILLFLFGTLVYTDRNILLRFMLFCLVAFILSFNGEGITSKKNWKLIKVVGVFVVLIAVIFWLYGRLKRYTSNFERMVGIYGGSGLYAFNFWLKDFNNSFSEGAFAFSTLVNSLARFGIGNGAHNTPGFGFIAYRSSNGYVFATNIYSALRVYYEDFGLLGIIGASFFQGLLFETIYQKAVDRRFGFWWLFYCAHIYHVIYFPIQEQFFMRFHLGHLYEIFWLWFFYYVVYGKHGLGRTKIRILGPY